MNDYGSGTDGSSANFSGASHIGQFSVVCKQAAKATLLAGKLQFVQKVQSSLSIRMPVTMQKGEMFLQFAQSSCESFSMKLQYMRGVWTSAISLASSGKGFRTIFSIFFLYCS